MSRRAISFCMLVFGSSLFNQSSILLGNDDAKKLLGTWKYVSVTHEGKPLNVAKDATVTITKDKWTVQKNGKTNQTTWEIDRDKSPKHLTRIFRGGKINFVDKSIYKFQMDRLIICESSYYNQRPNSFTSVKGDSQYLIVLRRRPEISKKTQNKSVDN